MDKEGDGVVSVEGRGKEPAKQTRERMQSEENSKQRRHPTGSSSADKSTKQKQHRTKHTAKEKERRKRH